MQQKIAPLCYLTPAGFIKAAIQFAAREDKRAVDQFHLRQSFGLYMMLLFFVILFAALDSSLFYAETPQLIVLSILFVLWFLGFRAAMAEKETPLPLIGRPFQKWFAFVGK